MTRHKANAGHSGVHREVWELLPWYGNGTLDGQEHQNVEAHLSTCAVCRAELARCRELAAAVHTAEEVSWSPSPEHLSRVLSHIDAAEARRAWASDWWRRLCTRCLGYRSSLQGTPPVVRWALVAQGALILLLAAIIAWQAPFPPGRLYRTLADSSDQMPQDRTPIRVVFAEDITEKEIRALLTDVKGTIVKGPSPLGVYTVEVPRSGGSPDRVGAVLDVLRAHRKVRLAEPTSTR